MPEYTLIVKIPNAGNKEISYSVKLTGSYEDYPEDYFLLENSRSNICQALQTQSGRKLESQQLKWLINEWVHNIKEGRRNTNLSLELSEDISSTSSQARPAAPFTPTLLENSAYIPQPQQHNRAYTSAEGGSAPSHPSPLNEVIQEEQELAIQEEQEPIRKILATNNEVDIEVKKKEFCNNGVLEYYSPQGQRLREVGGLECLKAWVLEHQPWFEQDTSLEMRSHAIFLEGFPGCGKTLSARAIASEWSMPQIKFDISRIQSNCVNESERNMLEALRVIEASAPNILLLDELEKAFVNEDAAEVSTCQFETFLSWLSDQSFPIFIATSSDRTVLPPELFHAMHFDDTFIVMPPTTKERSEIIYKRVQFHKLPPIPPLTLDFLVEETAGFSGAELDQVVERAIDSAGVSYLPVEENWRQALAEIVPQYRTSNMQALLQKYLRLLEEGNGKPASVAELGFWESLIT